MSEHPLCCDCLECLGGAKLGYRPFTYKTLGRPPIAFKGRERSDSVDRTLSGSMHIGGGCCAAIACQTEDVSVLAAAYMNVLARRAARGRTAA